MAKVEEFIKEISQYDSILLDTNAIIYFLSGLSEYEELLEPLFELIEQCRIKVNISVITEAELLVKPYRDNNEEAIKAVLFLTEEFSNLKTIPVTKEIAREAARIRAELGLKLPDAIIISTAVNTNCGVIVGNDIELLKKSVSFLPSVILSHFLNGVSPSLR